ncbi:hypothetical protein GQ602_001064 [Ophiocordyceps camponoti-floridani]|uniref:Heterokaryon incompatibility domain-containing protein n=1 Tax=Ophiocordyceps camponoti-floridani TaxID=2030778 RepID=A0A8H4QDD5_9HYPO|nr:hypothetical protein GQ602_001064 [Ophiocordyceps camponoti-floridani]
MPMAETSLALVIYSLLGQQMPSFTALSYVWGDARDTVTLSYAGGTASMTRNLRAILECLVSSGSREKLVWIDALCINQADMAERSQQARLMGDIYSRASPVLVFLSTISGPYELGLGFLTQAAEHPDRHCEPSHMTLPPSDRDSDVLRDSVVAVFAAPWWTRVWTVQDFVLASSLVFRFGGLEMDERMLLAALASLKAS